MSAVRRPMSRATHPRPGSVVARCGALLLVLPLVASGAVVVSSAEPTPVPIAVTAETALRSGTALALVARDDLAPALIQVRPAAAPEAGPLPAALLAVAPDGRMVALAERPGLDQTTLTLARGDGSQVRVDMPGLLGATFAPDGSWLAAVDGHGSLWRVATDDGLAGRILDGPILGPLGIGPDGTLLALAVASVEAPFVSHLVRINPVDQSVTRLTEDELVYGARSLDDGSIGVVAHQPGRTVVRRLAGGANTIIADLGPGAVNVTLSADGRSLAWEQDGEGILVLERPGATPRLLGPGLEPRFAPDGRSVLVREEGGGFSLLTLGGLRVPVEGLAAFAGCSAGCRP